MYDVNIERHFQMLQYTESVVRYSDRGKPSIRSRTCPIVRHKSHVDWLGFGAGLCGECLNHIDMDTLLHRYIATLLSCYIVTLLYCYIAILLHSYITTLKGYKHNLQMSPQSALLSVCQHNAAKPQRKYKY